MPDLHMNIKDKRSPNVHACDVANVKLQVLLAARVCGNTTHTKIHG